MIKTAKFVVRVIPPLALLATVAFAPNGLIPGSRAQNPQQPIDPDFPAATSVQTFTPAAGSASIPGVTLRVSQLSDGSYLASGTAAGTSPAFMVDFDTTSGTYTLSQTSAAPIGPGGATASGSNPPPQRTDVMCSQAPGFVMSSFTADGAVQAQSSNSMAWIGFVDGTFNYTGWEDSWLGGNPSADGLHWTVPVLAVNGPYNPNGNIFILENDTYVKFKNLDWNDPTLKTLILQSMQLVATCGTPTVTYENRVKGEGINHFHRFEVNRFQ